jgi:hypothetical protein
MDRSTSVPEDGRMVDPDVVPSLIRRRLQDGRLPHGRVWNPVNRAGDGQLCDACGAIVTSDQIAIEGSLAENVGRPLQFHALCFRIWDNERALGHTA